MPENTNNNDSRHNLPSKDHKIYTVMQAESLVNRLNYSSYFHTLSTQDQVNILTELETWLTHDLLNSKLAQTYHLELCTDNKCSVYNTLTICTHNLKQYAADTLTLPNGIYHEMQTMAALTYKISELARATYPTIFAAQTYKIATPADILTTLAYSENIPHLTDEQHQNCLKRLDKWLAFTAKDAYLGTAYHLKYDPTTQQLTISARNLTSYANHFLEVPGPQQNPSYTLNALRTHVHSFAQDTYKTIYRLANAQDED